MITTDRFIAAIRALVRDLMPSVDYLGFYAYSVASFDEASQTADLQPLHAGKLPDLRRIDVRAPASRVKLIPGGTVLVGFEDGDPSRPFVAFFDRASAFATALPAARQGDLVRIPVNLIPVPPATSGPPWIVAYPPTSIATPPAGPTAIGALYATISTGSTTVKTQS